MGLLVTRRLCDFEVAQWLSVVVLLTRHLEPQEPHVQP